MLLCLNAGFKMSSEKRSGWVKAVSMLCYKAPLKIFSFLTVRLQLSSFLNALKEWRLRECESLIARFLKERNRFSHFSQLGVNDEL